MLLVIELKDSEPLASVFTFSTPFHSWLMLVLTGNYLSSATKGHAQIIVSENFSFWAWSYIPPEGSQQLLSIYQPSPLEHIAERLGSCGPVGSEIYCPVYVDSQAASSSDIYTGLMGPEAGWENFGDSHTGGGQEGENLIVIYMQYTCYSIHASMGFYKHVDT